MIHPFLSHTIVHNSPDLALMAAAAPIMLLSLVGAAIAFIFWRRHASESRPGAHRPLTPLDAHPITESDLRDALADLQEALDALARGEESQAIALIMGRPRRVAHNLDGPVWERNAELGSRLCLCLLEAVEEATRLRRPPHLAEVAQELSQTLQQAGQVMGLIKLANQV